MSHFKQFGKYEIVRKLSRSLTDVYLARDSETGALAVLKLVEQSRDEFTQLVIEAERRGAVLQKQLHQIDPRILQVYDFGEQQNCFFVAMEYFEGKTVAEILREQSTIDPKRAARYAAEISDQLKTLHAFVSDVDGHKTAVVHGDIKPSNIQIGSNDEVRLLDFGIAKVISLTRNLTHHNLGSPSYCSPERLSKGQVDAQADLWALGVTLFEMISGLPPYQAENTRKLENLIQSRRPPRALPDTCPPGLRAVIEKSLASNLNERYQTAEALEGDLRAFLSDRATVAETEARQSWNAAPTIARYPAESRSTKLVAKTRTMLKLPERVKVALRPADLRRAAIALISGFVLGVGVLMPAAYLYRFHRASEALKAAQDYVARDPAAIASDWNLFQQLQKESHFLGRFSPVREVAEPLRARFVSTADKILGDYRSSASSAPERFDWNKAQLCLRHALEINPSDAAARGRLALCNAYGILTKHPRLPEASASIQQFNEAERLLPHSPDPHLGLARLYVYAYKNVEPGIAELRKAESLGYHMGAKEAAEEADGYLYRAQWEFLRARYTVPQAAQKRWLTMAEADVARARKLRQFDQSGAQIEPISLPGTLRLWR
ncbi:MAG: serine/threonine protein kinase [Acidobacteriaceae bacterium]|nr:serine/threonine protein kinase [Acidobacteriaceae bacterium]